MTLQTAKKVKLNGSRKAILKLGSRSFKAAGGKTVAVKVKLSRTARSLVRRSKRLKVKLTVVARDQANNSRTATRMLTLR